MTDTPPAGESRALAPTEQRQIHRVENLQPMLDSNRFEHFQRAASALMHSTILNPSIRGQTPQQCFSNLMLVFDLSDRWKLPALSIAQCITIVHDKVVYEGKLITAMLQATLGVTLHFHYTGERGTDAYRIYVSDQDWSLLDDEALAKVGPDKYPRGWRCIDGCVKDWKTLVKDGSKATPAWTGAAQRNQLAYRGSREWTRLYEPAQLLGVYGDDELDAMTIRMDRARDVTPAAPVTASLSSFRSTTPATPAAETEPHDPVTGEVAQDPQEGGQDAQVDAAATTEAAEPVKPAAKPKAAARPKAKDKPKADQVLTHEDGAQAEIDRMAEEQDAAYAAGQMGQTELARPDWYVEGDKASETRWQALMEALAEGLRDREAARKGEDPDATDPVETDLEGDDDNVSGEEDDSSIETHGFPGDASAVDAITAWTNNLADLMDWPTIKASMNALAKTDAWDRAIKEAPTRISEVRRQAWLREAELINAGQDRMDFINDLTAFRCWIETTTDEEAIQGNWMTLVRQPIYTNLQEGPQQGLQQAVMARLEDIKRGKGS